MRSHPSPLRTSFNSIIPIGTTDGHAPGTLFFNPPTPFRTDVYVGTWWKPSNPWQGDTSGVNKMIFLFSDALQTDIIVNMASFGVGPFTNDLHQQSNVETVCNTQGHLPTCSAVNWVANVNTATLAVGAWHQVEALIHQSTTTSSLDGSVKLRVDGVLRVYYTGINTPTGAWSEFQVSPTWGGNGGPNKTEDDFFWFDHLHISTGIPDNVASPNDVIFENFDTDGVSTDFQTLQANGWDFLCNGVQGAHPCLALSISRAANLVLDGTGSLQYFHSGPDCTAAGVCGQEPLGDSHSWIAKNFPLMREFWEQYRYMILPYQGNPVLFINGNNGNVSDKQHYFNPAGANPYSAISEFVFSGPCTGAICWGIQNPNEGIATQTLGSTPALSGSTNTIGGTTFGNWQNGTTSTHQSICGTTFHNFSNGKNCTTNRVGSNTFTNCN